MKFTIKELTDATNAVVLSGLNNSGFFGISTDTRTIQHNDIYLPLCGENFDGHQFIQTAIDNGARGYFTNDKKHHAKNAKLTLYVEDTTEAYLKLARYYKWKIDPITIAITGSSGKTTTKEMMASVISERYKTHKSQLNHNNEIGLCQTMLSMKENTEVLILEMGMRALGEIELLSKYSQPDIAVIVNSGTAHIGRLGSVENIAKAKCEITAKLHPEGLLIAHDTELLKSANTYEGQTVYIGLDSSDLKIDSMKLNSSKFTYKEHKYKLNVEGEYNIQNALFVIEAGLRLGITPEKIAKGLAKYRPIGQRWEVEETKGLKIINDSYNANPDSLKAALTTFLSVYEGVKALVLGDMGELGKDEVFYHEEIGRFLDEYLEKYPQESELTLITVGKLAKNIASCTKLKSVSFEKNEEVSEYIFENIPEGTTILFKASRSMKLENIIEELKKQ